MEPLALIARQIHALDRREMRAWLRRGELLSQAQTLCTKDREFSSWLRQSGINKRTAYRAIAAWRDFGNVPTSARFSKEAMQVLAGDAEGIAAAVELSKRQRITSRTARQLIHKRLPFAPTLDKKAAAQARKKISGPGFIVEIRYDRVPTNSDLLSAVLHAVSVLREEQRIGRDLAA